MSPIRASSRTRLKLVIALAAGLSLYAAGATAQTTTACGGSGEALVFELNVGRIVDNQVRRVPDMEGGSAVLLDVWPQRHVALFVTAGHVAQSFAGAGPGQDFPLLNGFDAHGNATVVDLRAAVPCADIRQVNGAASGGGSPCTINEAADIAVVRTSLPTSDDTIALRLGCSANLLLYPPSNFRDLTGWGFPASPTPRQRQATGNAPFEASDGPSSQFKFDGQAQVGMSGGGVFARGPNQYQLLVGVLRQFTAITIQNPALNQTPQFSVQRTGATAFSDGVAGDPFLADRVTLELCGWTALPNAGDARATIQRVAGWDCISPRVAMILTWAASPPDHLDVRLNGLEGSRDTRLTDFDLLQLEMLARHYPAIREALLTPRDLHLFWLHLAGRAQMGADLSVGSAVFDDNCYPPTRLMYTLSDPRNAAMSRVANDAEFQERLSTIVVESVQAEQRSGGVSSRTLGWARQTLDRLTHVEQSRSSFSPDLHQQILFNDARLSHLLSREASQNRLGLLARSITNLQAGFALAPLAEHGLERNARTIAAMYTVNSQWGESLRAYVRAEQIQPSNDHQLLTRLLDLASASGQVAPPAATQIRQAINEGSYVAAINSTALIAPTQNLRFDLSRVGFDQSGKNGVVTLQATTLSPQ